MLIPTFSSGNTRYSCFKSIPITFFKIIYSYFCNGVIVIKCYNKKKTKKIFYQFIALGYIFLFFSPSCLLHPR